MPRLNAPMGSSHTFLQRNPRRAAKLEASGRNMAAENWLRLMIEQYNTATVLVQPPNQGYYVVPAPVTQPQYYGPLVQATQQQDYSAVYQPQYQHYYVPALELWETNVTAVQLATEQQPVALLAQPTEVNSPAPVNLASSTLSAQPEATEPAASLASLLEGSTQDLDPTPGYPWQRELDDGVCTRWHQWIETLSTGDHNVPRHRECNESQNYWQPWEAAVRDCTEPDTSHDPPGHEEPSKPTPTI
jgi:hypothetical protein